MIKSFVFSISILLASSLVFSQSNKEQSELFRLGEQGYTVENFNYYFLKNSEKPAADSAKKKVKEYMSLYVKFRLKVQEAVALGQDKEADFINEFEGYSKQLAEPYLMQTQVKGQMVQEAYDRMNTEVSAAHILIKVEKGASPEDTLVAYNKTLAIMMRVEGGEDFGAVATEMSEDPSAKQNDGVLGYFSALQMVYPFENAVYNNEVGTIVGPVKTQFGYHILKVIDKRPARGKILTAHIMIQSKPDSTAMEAARQKAISVYDNLQKGQDWNEQCELYSDDRRSKSSGGKLQWFGTGNLVPEYEDAAFALETSGDYTAPVQTQFGWHIIKLLDKKGIDSFEEMQADLEKKVSRDARAKNKKSTTLKNLKVSQNFALDQEVQTAAFAEIDTSLLKGKWVMPSRESGLASKQLLITNQVKFDVAGFWKFVIQKQKTRINTSLSVYLDQLYNQYEEKCIFDQELENIKRNNFDYQMVLDEYRSGILLFNLMEKEVWSKAMKDTVGLQGYYDGHKNQYKMDEHLVARRFVSRDTLVLRKVASMLDKTNSELDSIFNAKEPLTLQTFDEKMEKGANAFLDNHWAIGTYEEHGETYATLWDILEVKPNGYKAMNSIKGMVISDYQKELEDEWVKVLQKKYPMKINKTALKAYINSFE